MKCIELFAGAGGLAMGIAKTGFKHAAVIEWDKDACDTIRGLYAYPPHRQKRRLCRPYLSYGLRVVPARILVLRRLPIGLDRWFSAEPF